MNLFWNHRSEFNEIVRTPRAPVAEAAALRRRIAALERHVAYLEHYLLVTDGVCVL